MDYFKVEMKRGKAVLEPWRPNTTRWSNNRHFTEVVRLRRILQAHGIPY